MLVSGQVLELTQICWRVLGTQTNQSTTLWHRKCKFAIAVASIRAIWFKRCEVTEKLAMWGDRQQKTSWVLSVINSAFLHPLISKVMSWQCFLTVLILGSTYGFRATVFCLFVYCYFDVLPPWCLLRLHDTSCSFQTLPGATLYSSWFFLLLSLQHCCHIKIITNKQTKYSDSESHQHTLNNALLKSTVSW